METYGLIYNKDLLAKYIATDGAKMTSVDKTSTISIPLKAVADDIQAKKDQLGVKGAFTSAGFDSSSDWRFKTHLADLPLTTSSRTTTSPSSRRPSREPILPNFKNIFDLYITDSTTDPHAAELQDR